MANKSIEDYEKYLLKSIQEAEEMVAKRFLDRKLQEMFENKVSSFKKTYQHLKEFQCNE